MKHFANFNLNQAQINGRRVGALVGTGAGLLSGSGVFDTQEERDNTNGIERFNSVVGRATLGRIAGGWAGGHLGQAGAQIGKAVELGKNPVYNYNRKYSRPHNPEEAKGYTTIEVNPRKSISETNYSSTVNTSNFGVNPALLVGGGLLGGYVGGRVKRDPNAEKDYDSLDKYYFNNEGKVPEEELLKTVTEREANLNTKHDNYRSKNNKRALIGAGVGLLGGLALSKGLNRVAPLA